jgi:hypothetical protein
MKRTLLGLSFFVVSLMTFTGMSKTPQPQPGTQPRTEVVRGDKPTPEPTFRPTDQQRRCPDCRKFQKPCRKHFSDRREMPPMPDKSPRPDQSPRPDFRR